jgi:hypothetical protein
MAWAISRKGTRSASDAKDVLRRRVSCQKAPRDELDVEMALRAVVVQKKVEADWRTLEIMIRNVLLMPRSTPLSERFRPFLDRSVSLPRLLHGPTVHGLRSPCCILLASFFSNTTHLIDKRNPRSSLVKDSEQDLSYEFMKSWEA